MSTVTGDESNDTDIAVTLQELNDAEVRGLIPTIAYLVVLCVVGLVGNSLVCHVYRTRYRLSNSQCFILCLSAIDLFSCVVVIPLEVATIIDQYTFHHLWLCKLSRFFNTLGTLSSSFLLLFIAIDRYRKVCRPFGWQIKSSIAKFLCVLSVILGLIFSWPAIFIYGIQRFEIPHHSLNGTECSTDDTMLTTMFPLINAAVFGGLFIVGIISICILYCFIGREVHKHAQKMPKNLTVRNPSVPMLSSTTDPGRNSRVSGELDPNTLAKYDIIKGRKQSQRKTSSTRKPPSRLDSEGSWTDKKDFELSCSMDCSVADDNVMVSVKDRAESEETQSEDSGIRTDQTNKEENEENASKSSVGHVDIPRDVNGEPGDLMCNNNKAYVSDNSLEDIDTSVGSLPKSSSQKALNGLAPVKEHDTESDENSIGEAENDIDLADEIRRREFEESDRSRKFSELSCTSDIVKPETLRKRLFLIWSRLSTAVYRRMTSLVSTASAGSVTVVKTQYLKQARARKTAFLMFLISLAFVLSYMPHLLLMIVRQLKDQFVESMSDDGRAVYKFFLRSYFLNCAINPVIYGVCDSRFRSACKEIFSRCCGRGTSHDMN